MHLKEHLINEHHFTEADYDSSIKYMKMLELKPRDFFLEQGKISDKIGLVISGLLRSYTLNDDGEQITTSFYEIGAFVISAKSLEEKTPAQESIVAVDNTQILTVNADDLPKLFAEVPKWHSISLSLSSYNNEKINQRAYDLQTLSAKERYLKLIETSPEIIKKAALKDIASYLGIDAVSLSRIRRQIIE
jgi:CRP-like cAMP-binding protein